MKKILGYMAMICVLHVVAGVGLAGYLVATGRIDASKVKVIADLARHKGTPEKLREKVGDILEPISAPAASAPASQKGAATQESVDERMTANAEARINAVRQAMEQERIHLESQAQELRHRQELLENLQASLETDRKNFEAEKKAFAPKLAGADDKIKAENFQKTLALYDELKTKQVKDLLMENGKEDLVASYLTAMEPSRAGKIIGEFKSETELKFIKGVLERIRVAGTSSASVPGAGGDVAAAAPRP